MLRLRVLDEGTRLAIGTSALLAESEQTDRPPFVACRALAAGIRSSTCSAAEAVYFERCDQPAPHPARCLLDCPVDSAPIFLLRNRRWSLRV